MDFANSVFSNLMRNYEGTELLTSTMVAVFVVVGLVAAFEFVVYRFVLHRALYNKSFNISISVIPFFIATIILCLQTNLVITLGTIGVMAIVRFRTAVKDPVDMIFILWSIHIGITCGCQLYKVAVLTSIVVTIVLVIMNYFSFGSKSHVLVIHMSGIEGIEEIENVVKEFAAKYRLKSRNVSSHGANLVFELNTKRANELTEKLSQAKMVSQFSLMEYEPDDIL